jgi:hypothetical protein
MADAETLRAQLTREGVIAAFKQAYSGIAGSR